MELHHAEYRDEIHEFMKVSLVFNLCQGSAKCPDDVRYVGMKCKLPIIRHRLQRLFNRKLIDTIVQFDTYRLALDAGFYDPVNRDILDLRLRTPPINNKCLKEMVLRFGKGMSGLALTTIPTRPY